MPACACAPRPTRAELLQYDYAVDSSTFGVSIYQKSRGLDQKTRAGAVRVRPANYHRHQSGNNLRLVEYMIEDFFQRHVGKCTKFLNRPPAQDFRAEELPRESIASAETLIAKGF
ncbi:hypothetical protein EVAR_65291_1 [Eumeta japonica]|uniref:Uncharacterized protein n=1 Tax=Eumeta variegata TaxID=151549 RepID=A0A4C1ZNG1_EUMVA|nr:hypothetical protein EVAR_65291_1 [Eumeta japonica]